MLETRRIALAFVLTLLGVVAASANTVITKPTAGTGVFTGGSITPAYSGNPFWDNKSNDSTAPRPGPGCNVGNWLNEQTWAGSAVAAACSGEVTFGTGGPGTGNWSYLSSNTSTATPVGWTMQASGPISPAVMRLEIAGNKNQNRFGWYTVNPSNGVTGFTELFTGLDAPGASDVVTVAAGTEFGFYLCPSTVNCTDLANFTNNAFLSGATVTTSTGRGGKLALFSEKPALPGPNSQITEFWIGIEDLKNTNGEGWGDYNDMLIKMTVVPEPGFYGALALMMSGLYVVVSRRRKNESK